MGLGFRIFFVGENDSIKRISFAKFDRLCNQGSKEQLPEYANKRMKYALAILVYYKFSFSQGALWLVSLHIDRKK